MHRISVKVYRAGDQVLVAACDAELLGATFKEGKLRLCVKREFYEGKLMDPEKAIKAVEEADIANLIGKNIVGLAIQAGLIHPDAVIAVEGTPHAQMVRVRGKKRMV